MTSIRDKTPLWKSSIRKSFGRKSSGLDTEDEEDEGLSFDHPLASTLKFTKKNSDKGIVKKVSEDNNEKHEMNLDERYICQIVEKAAFNLIELEPDDCRLTAYCFADSHFGKSRSSTDDYPPSFRRQSTEEADNSMKLRSQTKLSIGAYGLQDIELQAEDDDDKVMFEDYIDSDDPDFFKLDARALAKVRLMDECQPSKVMKKYMARDTISFLWRPNDFTTECEVAATKVRKRLQNLIGSDEICLNDRDYMNNLQEKIEEEHSRRLVQREKYLREQEKKRVRKLFLEGVIDFEDYDDSTTRKNEKYDKNVTSFSGELYPDFTANPAQLTFREILEEKYRSGSSEQKSKSSSSKRESSSEVNEKKDDETEPIESESQHEESGTNADKAEEPKEEEPATSHEENDTHASPESESTSKTCRPYSARMDQLEKEEDISAIYELARQMVFISASDRRGK